MAVVAAAAAAVCKSVAAAAAAGGFIKSQTQSNLATEISLKSSQRLCVDESKRRRRVVCVCAFSVRISRSEKICGI